LRKQLGGFNPQPPGDSNTARFKPFLPFSAADVRHKANDGVVCHLSVVKLRWRLDGR